MPIRGVALVHSILPDGRMIIAAIRSEIVEPTHSRTWLERNGLDPIIAVAGLEPPQVYTLSFPMGPVNVDGVMSASAL